MARRPSRFRMARHPRQPAGQLLETLRCAGWGPACLWRSRRRSRCSRSWRKTSWSRCLSMRCLALLSRTSRSAARHRPRLLWTRRQVCSAALTGARGLRANGSGRSLRMKRRKGACPKVALHQGQGLTRQTRRSKRVGPRAARALLECWRRLTLTIHQSAARSARVRRVALCSGDRTRPRPV